MRARKLSKFETIDAEVRRGARLDTLRYSLSANHQHGLKRTNEDKRHAIHIALREWSEWSDRAIADLVGVSHPSVAAIRRQLENFTSCEHRVGMDGKRRRKPVGLSVEEEPYQLPVAGVDDQERSAHAITMEVAQKLGDLESTIRSGLRRFPRERLAILGLIRKVRSDLAQLERDILPAGR